MNHNSSDVGNSFRDLFTRFGAEMMHSMRRYNEYLQHAASGEWDAERLREEYIALLRDETGRYMGNLASLSVGYYNALLELGSIYNPPFFDHVFNREPVRGDAAPPREELRLHGPVGQHATASFVVENQASEKDDVAFVVSEFVGSVGTPAFRPPLHLVPPRFTLNPHENREVTVRLALWPELFTPDELYTATITVQRREGYVIRLHVVPQAPAMTAEPPFRPATKHSQTF